MANNFSFCNLQTIRPDVNTDHLDNKIEIKDIRYFANTDTSNDLENKALALMILRCMPGESSKASSYGGGQQKKPRFNYNIGKPYHRWILCAELANPPNCFAIITDNLSQTNRLLIHSLDETYLGKCFYLVEPNMTKGKAGNSPHIVQCDDMELLPLKWNSKVLAMPAKIVLPTTSDETFYFS